MSYRKATEFIFKYRFHKIRFHSRYLPHNDITFSWNFEFLLHPNNELRYFKLMNCGVTWENYISSFKNLREIVVWNPTLLANWEIMRSYNLDNTELPTHVLRATTPWRNWVICSSLLPCTFDTLLSRHNSTILIEWTKAWLSLPLSRIPHLSPLTLTSL